MFWSVRIGGSSLFLRRPVVRNVFFLRYTATPHQMMDVSVRARLRGPQGARVKVRLEFHHSERTSTIGAVSGFCLDDAGASPGLYPGPAV